MLRARMRARYSSQHGQDTGEAAKHIIKNYQHASKHINDCARLFANTPAMRYNTDMHTNTVQTGLADSRKS
jgi:hypothetical protein